MPLASHPFAAAGALEESNLSGTVTLDAVATGGGGVVGMQNSPRAAGMLPFNLIFYCGYGKTKFTKPYCVPVSTAF